MKTKFEVTKAAVVCVQESFYVAKYRAKKGSRYVGYGEYSGRKKAFRITQHGLLNILRKQKGRCALTGVPLTFVTEKTIRRGGAVGDPATFSPTNLSIDRIDPRYGYLPNNVQLVTNFANKAKGEMQTLEFLKMCKKVVRKLEKPKRKKAA